METATRVAVTILVLLTMTAAGRAQEGMSRDQDGWTILKPSTDTRICYVSASEGDDAAGAACAPGDAAVGADPFLPSGAVKPFKTVQAALAKMRDGFPDWVLLRRGEAWPEGLNVRTNGRSASERLVIGAYGPAKERPLLKVGGEVGLRLRATTQFAAVTGLDFCAHTRDPKSPDYQSLKGNTAVQCLMRQGQTLRGVLLEDCAFRFFTNLTIQTMPGGATEDVAMRRCLVLDAYSDGQGHSQGMFTQGVTMLLEENVFDHDGWLSTRTDDVSVPGRATIFNHDTYFCEPKGVAFRGNMFLRGSSGDNKWTANSGPGSARDILMDDNLYVEGEAAIGIGGNVFDPLRFVNVQIVNNVVLDVGRSQPTGRTLGWGLQIRDWDGGTVESNLFLHQANDAVNNVYGINVGGTNRNVTIRNNIIHGLTSGVGIVLQGGGAGKKGAAPANAAEPAGDADNGKVVLTGNTVQLPAGKALVQLDGDPAGFALSGNVYQGPADPSKWFAAAKQPLAMEAWLAASGETSATVRTVAFPHPERTVETYNESLGGKATLEDFIAEVRKQSKTHWRPAYTARAVNAYMREGFALKPAAVPAKWPPAAAAAGTK